MKGLQRIKEMQNNDLNFSSGKTFVFQDKHNCININKTFSLRMKLKNNSGHMGDEMYSSSFLSFPPKVVK